MAETTQPRTLKPLTPLRTLFLNLMFGLLVASAVFVVVAKLVLVPQLARQELEIRQLRTQVSGLRADLDAATAADAAPAAAPAAPGSAAPGSAAPAAPGAVPAGAVPAAAQLPTGK